MCIKWNTCCRWWRLLPCRREPVRGSRSSPSSLRRRRRSNQGQPRLLHNAVHSRNLWTKQWTKDASWWGRTSPRGYFYSPREAADSWSQLSTIFARWQHTSQSWLCGGALGTLILGKGKVVEGKRWHHSKDWWWFPACYQRPLPYLNNLAIWLQFAMECFLCSSKQGGGVNLGQNLERKELTDVSQILTRSGTETGLLYATEVKSVSSAILAQCTYIIDRRTDRQTDRPVPRNGNIDCNRQNRLSAMSPKNTTKFCHF